jgi:hypothetical protein
MKHKHYDVIVAWAEGKKIQYINTLGNWEDWNESYSPGFDNWAEYRIKPEPLPDIVRYYYVDSHYFTVSQQYTNHTNLKITFDGATGNLKSAEVFNGN